MAPRRELAPQGERREGVAGVAEGGEKQAPAARAVAQTSSASSRIMRRRASGSGDTGVVISVPTPASR